MGIVPRHAIKPATSAAPSIVGRGPGALTPATVFCLAMGVLTQL